MQNSKDILFPHKKVRKIQDEMLQDVLDAIKNKKDMILHAPTGIGKTVSVLAPSLGYALRKKLRIFFLTSRHTQHEIALKTLKKIKKTNKKDFLAVDIIGKKWMCLQDGVQALFSSDFSDYCKKLKEENQCEFYINLRSKKKLSVQAKVVINEIKKHGPFDSEEIIKICKKQKLCPYEISSILCRQADVIIGDYYHIFSENIRKNIFKKSDIDLSNAIILIDEGHNLPARIRNLTTTKLSNIAIKRALKEAKKFEFQDTIENLKIIKKAFDELSEDLNINNQEKLISKSEIYDKIDDIKPFENIVSDLIFIGDNIREQQKQSFVGSIGSFLENWQGPDSGFTRILSLHEGKRDPIITLSYICMDPSIITKDIISNSYSTILMSGTLTPTSMYRDILGFEEPIEKKYPSPFPKKNKLSMIIPDTTTKFTRRNEQEYHKIASFTAEISNLVPGNIIIFFPSYRLRDDIYKYFFEFSEKTAFLEKPNFTKEEKLDMLKKFGSYKKTGAVMLAVATGSFGEGIDLPGDLLKAVVVVGLPLEKPTLEIKELIKYYDNKFGKGWDYGYILPAIIKSLQNAGRCIRTEDDKGITVFLDERYVWPNYFKCFPPDMDIKITKMFQERISEFFGIG